MPLLKGFSLFLGFCLFAFLFGCSPEVGSEEWCKDMKETPKGNWTASEVADYAKHCLMR